MFRKVTSTVWLLGSLLFAALLSLGGCSISIPDNNNDDNNNIYAVIVSSSRYWFNYRHAMNALGIYDILKTNDIPDSHIILMLADEYATNARNSYKNGMYANGVTSTSWYSNETEVDFRGSDVTVQNFLDSVLGISPISLKGLNSNSNLVIYLTGHGGDQFFKFQDEEELTAQDIANLSQELADRKRFKRLLWIADTCQAFTLFDKLETPETLALGTSLRDQNAYAHHFDNDLGLSVIERWTNGFIAQYNDVANIPTSSLYDVMAAGFENRHLGAEIGLRDDHSSQKFKDVLVSDFFGTKANNEGQRPHSVKAAKGVVELNINSEKMQNTTTRTRSPPPRILKKMDDNNRKPTSKSSEDEREQQPNQHKIDMGDEEPQIFPFVVMIALAVLLCHSLEKTAFN